MNSATCCIFFPILLFSQPFLTLSLCMRTTEAQRVNLPWWLAHMGQFGPCSSMRVDTPLCCSLCLCVQFDLAFLGRSLSLQAVCVARGVAGFTLSPPELQQRHTWFTSTAITCSIKNWSSLCSCGRSFCLVQWCFSVSDSAVFLLFCITSCILWYLL